MIVDWKSKRPLVTTCMALSIALLIQSPCISAVGQTAISTVPNATEIQTSPATGQESTVLSDSGSLSTTIEKTLGEITFVVQDMYYDGHIALLTMRQTASQADAVIVDEVFGDSTNDNPLYGGAGKTVIPTYFDISFFTKMDGQKPNYFNASGGSMNSGNPLNCYGILSLLPLDVSPTSVKAEVTIATLTPQLDTYEEMDRFILDIPKTDEPLVDAALDLDVGSTVVKHITISRTSLFLVVYVYHQPVERNGDRSFSVYSCGGAVLKDAFSNMEELANDGWECVERAYVLSKNDPLPEALRLHYNGGTAKDLAVDLTTGTVEVLE